MVEKAELFLQGSVVVTSDWVKEKVKSLVNVTVGVQNKSGQNCCSVA